MRRHWQRPVIDGHVPGVRILPRLAKSGWQGPAEFERSRLMMKYDPIYSFEIPEVLSIVDRAI